MHPLVTKPCEKCGEPVRDQDDPSYKGKWTCYHCHCLLTGRDVKATLNALSELIKTGQLVHVQPRAHQKVH